MEGDDYERKLFAVFWFCREATSDKKNKSIVENTAGKVNVKLRKVHSDKRKFEMMAKYFSSPNICSMLPRGSPPSRLVLPS